MPTRPSAVRSASGVPVAIIDIPHIGVHEVVVEGARSGQLREGPGHLVGSSLPGQPGNAVIAGRHTLSAVRSHTSRQAAGRRRGSTPRPGRAHRPTACVDIATVKAEDGSVFVDHGDDRLTLFTWKSRVDASGRLVVSAAPRRQRLCSAAVAPHARSRRARSHRRTRRRLERSRLAGTARPAHTARRLHLDPLVSLRDVDRVHAPAWRCSRGWCSRTQCGCFPRRCSPDFR